MDALVIAQFAFATLLPVIACVGLTLLRRIRCIMRIPKIWWQIIAGLVFGLIAVYGTEVGIPTNGATMNVRDAAPLAAGLFFGGPAGIIAGLIGGIERWFAVLWGAGEFTRLACSLGTITAGVYAALLHKYLFDSRMPSWPMAMATGLVVEVLHLLLVFLTNFDQSVRAFQVVQACALPMISCVGISVALSAIALARVNHRPSIMPRGQRGIAQVVQAYLLVSVFAVFVITVGFTAILQSSFMYSDEASLLRLNVSDVRGAIADASDENLLMLTNKAALSLPSAQGATNEECARVADDLDVAEVCMVDGNGIVIASSNTSFIGFDMSSGDQSRAFLCLLPGGGETEYVQSYQPMAYDETTWRKYAGVTVEGGFVQVGYDAQNFVDDISMQVEEAVRNRHVGKNGQVVVLDATGNVVSAGNDVGVQDARALSSDADGIQEGELFTTSFNGEECYATYEEVEGYRIIAVHPTSEVRFSLDVAVLITSFMEVLVFAILFLVVYFVIKRLVVRNIWHVNGALSRITGGDLSTQVNVRGITEFSSLSDDINHTVSALKGWIAEAESRMDTELATGRAIQENALPRAFPPFPEIKMFDIFADMNAAKQVGGDFYDLFLIGDSNSEAGKLGFVIADVSGKGVPAALFMMSAKSKIRYYMESGMELGLAVESANRELCEGNEAGMFVTAFAGVLDYKSMRMTCVNAGHNPPLVLNDNSCEWLEKRSGLPLGLFEDMPYMPYEIEFSPSDTFLLYTDGVTEAMDVEENLYGPDRLIDFVKERAGYSPRQLLCSVRADVSRFAEGAEQSDDITMLVLKVGVPPESFEQIELPASDEKLEEVDEFIHRKLEALDCPSAVCHKIDIAVEEMFVNVCHYAYPRATEDNPGTVRVSCACNTDPASIMISIVDKGISFNPLQKPTSEVSDDIDQVSIGGLGILMAKKCVDELTYERVEGKNIVRLVKHI